MFIIPAEGRKDCILETRMIYNERPKENKEPDVSASFIPALKAGL